MLNMTKLIYRKEAKIMSEETQWCYRCKKQKPLSEFYFSLDRRTKRQTMCKKCRTIYSKWYYQKPNSRKKQLERMHQFHLKNIEAEKAYGKIRSAKIKLVVFQKISGQEKPICSNCGCSDIRCLEVNHKNGGGNKEYRAYGTMLNGIWHSGGAKFYRAIYKGDRKTDDLNVLCRVCNNLEHLERRFGQLPFKIIWEGKTNE
jgi:hypothetical protein